MEARPLFSQSGVFDVEINASVSLFFGGLGGLHVGVDFYLCGVGFAQRQLIAVQVELDGVAHRCKLLHRNGYAGNKSHVEKMLAQCALSTHVCHNSTLTCR